MDKRGQRKAIKHAQPCVIGDANRWMLQKEFHHLYPFVAATIFAMPNKTGAAARSTSQSHMARNRSGGSSFMAGITLLKSITCSSFCLSQRVRNRKPRLWSAERGFRFWRARFYSVLSGGTGR